MDIQQKQQMLKLTADLWRLITISNCSDENKENAAMVVAFYIVNPITAKDPEFFKGVISDKLLTEYNLDGLRAPNHWVPLLTHILKTGCDLVLAELERLVEAEGIPSLTIAPDTAQKLIDRFVEGLAKYVGIDHKCYDVMSTTLLKSILISEDLPNATVT